MAATAVRVACLLVGFALAASVPGVAEEAGGTDVEPVASGHGDFVGSPAVLVDGVMPEEETAWDDTLNVSWSDTTVYFTVDLGSVRKVESIEVGVDNNDTYALETSVDRVAFTSLVVIPADSGEVETGIDCFASDETHPEYSGALAFQPVAARFVKITAVEGDEAYAVGEIHVMSSPLPEPAEKE